MKIEKILRVAILVIITAVIAKISFSLLNVVLATTSSLVVIAIRLIPTILIIYLLIKIAKSIIKK